MLLNFEQKKPHDTLYFWVFNLLFFIYLGWPEFLHFPVFGMHQGAQADRASVAWNYYQNDFQFFYPQVMENRAANGVTGLEFPIIQYMAALLRAAFGYSPALYRIVVGAFYLAGNWGVYQITKLIVPRLFHRFLIMLLWLSSPILAFYSFNHLPDVPALACTMLGYLFILRFYYDINKKQSFNLSIIWFTLSGLLKVTFLTNYIAVIIVLIASKLSKSTNSDNTVIEILDANGQPIQETSGPRANILNRLAPNPPFNISWFEIVAFILTPAIAVFSWYYYASFLTQSTGNTHFLQQMNPPKNWAEFLDNSRFALNTWIDSVYSRNFLILFLLVILISIQRKKEDLNLFSTFFLLGFGGFLCVFILFNRQFRFHDYYFVQLFPFIFFGILWLYQTHVSGKIFFNGIAGILSLIGLYITPFVLASNAKSQLNRTFTSGDYYCQNIFENIDDFRRAAYWIKKGYLNEKQEVAILFDPSPNTGLLLLQRPGIRIAPDFDSTTTYNILRDKKNQQIELTKSHQFEELIFINKAFSIPKNHWIWSMVEITPYQQWGQLSVHRLKL